MSSYKAILWDIDGTLLNFDAVEKIAMQKCFLTFNLGECTEEMLETYIPINQKYWRALERGEITKHEVLVGRFKEFFDAIGIVKCNPDEFDAEYQRQLASNFIFHDNGKEVVRTLKERGYLQFAATNGTKVAQEGKLHISGLDQLFDGIFISEIIGVEKPNKGFYDAIFQAVPEIHNNEIGLSNILMIGDSLTSDMRGGNNVGIDTCWFNHKKQINTTDVVVNYEIYKLEELMDFL